MKKRRICLFLILCVAFFTNTLSNFEVRAISNTIVFDVKERDYSQFLLNVDPIQFDNFENNLFSIEYESEFRSEEYSDKYYYIDQDGREVEYSIKYYHSTGLIYTPNGTDVSDFSLTDNYYFTSKYTTDHPDDEKNGCPKK